uniref:Uncharacterized protein n=1 Tax=Picea glauca TaxID=3330 RepID=A0A101LU28_PICGL|nr:hypothetical protein ABT39_MTgene3450 [Picea glauca]QHR87693.1 hypothetical protein Q903MT_gene1705 [Picea sitchensis]
MNGLCYDLLLPTFLFTFTTDSRNLVIARASTRWMTSSYLVQHLDLSSTLPICFTLF